ncbi:MAG: inverse autotransporter beta domain-containing protein [Chlamydiales bacterium]|nr:inverse autotransporter beta domain-containing protein [Chlamydiales bacterium]
MFDNGRAAVNAGLGSRWNIFGNWALGANFFYDFRDAKRLPVHQLGPGLELLSPYIDFRINGYIPIGTTQKLQNLTFSRFTGVGNSLVATRQYTAALPCLAGEVGLPLGPFLDPYFSVGPYYLYKQSQSTASVGGVWGGLGRLSLQLFDWMTIGGELSYDKLFKTRANGFVSLSLPLGPNTIRSNKSRWKNWYPTAECDSNAILQRVMTKDVVRQEIIPVASDNLQYSFDIECLFVDGDAPPGGDGTFEHPFNDLAAALAITPCQCIYVLGGTFVGQFPAPQCPLLGGACDQLVPTIQGVTVALPPLTTSYPVLTNPGGFIILEVGTSADIFIRGFEFRDGLIQIAIAGDGNNHVSLTCNRFTEVADAFSLTMLNTLVIDDNEFEYTQSPFAISWQSRSTNTMIRNNTVTTIGAGIINELYSAPSPNSSYIFDNNFVRGRLSTPTGAVHPSVQTSFLFSNNDIVIDGPIGYAVYTTSIPTPGSGSVQNNILVNTSGSTSSLFSLSSSYNGINYNNNTSSASNDVVFSVNIAGTSTCASFDANVANSYQFTAVAGSTVDVTQSLADLSANNVGTVTTSGAGTINFDTGCTP